MKHDGFYENWFEDGDSLYIAVFDSDRNNENDSPRFLFSYLLSINDLQKVNFHLTYPPTENMKDLHMWPSYEDVMTDSRKTEWITGTEEFNIYVNKKQNGLFA